MLYILHLTNLIDCMYGKNEPETYHYLKKMRSILDKFNEKYPEIHVALKKNTLNIFLRFFLKKETMNEVFDGFKNEISLKKRIFNNNAKITLEVSPEINKTYNQESEDTLALKKNANRNMVEVIYRDETLHNINSPEFKLLASHALSSYNKKINIRIEKDDVFCFDFDPESHNGEGVVYSPKNPSGIEPSY